MQCCHLYLFLPDEEINIGSLAEQGLLESGEISKHQKATFISAVNALWIAVHKYASSILPYNNEVLVNSQWIDFHRSEMKFSNVKFVAFLQCHWLRRRLIQCVMNLMITKH